MNNKVFIAIISVIVVGFLLFAITRPANNSGELSNNFAGNGSAEVVVIEGYSLACPACAQAHPIIKEIRQAYEDQIKLQVMHFPLTASFGANARIPHRAVEAAAIQGQDKFWALHDHIFENRDDWVGKPAEDIYTKMVEYAQIVGLNVEKFEIDYDSNIVNNKINNDIAYLQELGATATPAFFINGEKIETAEFATVELAKATIDKALGIADNQDSGGSDN